MSSPPPHGIPSIRPRDLQSYVDRLEAIRRDAESDELGTLVYLLDIAKGEAERLVKEGEHERQMRDTPPEQLWRPG